MTRWASRGSVYRARYSAQGRVPGQPLNHHSARRGPDQIRVRIDRNRAMAERSRRTSRQREALLARLPRSPRSSTAGRGTTPIPTSVLTGHPHDGSVRHFRVAFSAAAARAHLGRNPGLNITRKRLCFPSHTAQPSQ